MDNDTKIPVKTADQGSGAPADPRLGELKESKRSFWKSINPGFLAVGAAALWKPISMIDTYLYKIYEANGRLETLNAKIKDAYKQVYNDYELTDIDKTDLAQAIETQKANHSSYAIRNWEKKILRQMREADGISNIYDKWRRVKPYQRHNAIITYATVAAVGLGAVYTYSRETHLVNKLHRQIADQDVTQQINANNFTMVPHEHNVIPLSDGTKLEVVGGDPAKIKELIELARNKQNGQQVTSAI